MLDVDGGNHVDAGVEQLEDVFVPFLVRGSRRVRVGQLIDDRELRTTFLDGLQVHLLQGDAAVLDLALGQLLDVADARQGVGPAVRLDEGDDDIRPLPLQLVGVLEHLVGLAHAWRRTDVHAQPRTPFLP